MTNQSARGNTTISIDLADASTTRGQSVDRLSPATVEWALEQFSKCGIAATFAVDDPAGELAHRIRTADTQHEIAIAGDAAWLSPLAARAQTTVELQRRLARGRAVGLEMATLFAPTLEFGELTEVIARSGLSVVRPQAASSRSRGVRQPSNLRHGLRLIPITHTLPGASRWLPGGGGRRAVQAAIVEAVAAHSVVHLAIDLPHVARTGRSAQKAIERILAVAVQFERQHALAIATVAGTAACLAGHYLGKPSRSILRPAA